MGAKIVEKYYFVRANHPLNFQTFAELISAQMNQTILITTLSPSEGMFSAPADLAADFYSFLPLISNDLNNSFFILVSPKNDHLTSLMFAHPPIKSPGVYHLMEALMAAVIDKNTQLIEAAIADFINLPHALIQTADMYIQCGLNGLLASEKLYLHRNTFIYRLNQFIKLTGLDIRDYWNAQYYALARQIISNK